MREEVGGNEELKTKNANLRARVKELEARVEDLTQQMLKNHVAENKRLTFFLLQLSTSQFGPSH